MREIKFRAWGHFGNRKKDYMVENWQNTDLVEYVGFDGGGHFILMQYTGLKDKNGKEIYEGDVISWKLWSHIEPQFDVVEFDDGGFHPFPELNQHDNTTEQTYEVLGNIYENPELLEEK